MRLGLFQWYLPEPGYEGALHADGRQELLVGVGRRCLREPGEDGQPVRQHPVRMLPTSTQAVIPIKKSVQIKGAQLQRPIIQQKLFHKHVFMFLLFKKKVSS